MEAIVNTLKQRNTITSILLDLSALVFIFFVPTLSHLVALPIYFIEPMRIMLVLAMVHTTKRNAFLLALTLPLFSFLISSHPVFAKMLLISFELSINVYIFYLLKDKMKNVFPAIFISIIASKIIYYFIKYLLINFAILNSGLISTPIYIQMITTTVFSFYMYLLLRKEKI